MRRPGNWLLIGAVVLVGGAAAADSLRDAFRGGTPSTTAATAPTTTAAASPGGPTGVLYYTDQECRLRGLQLPELVEVGGPDWDGCEFSLSPDAREIDAEGSAWHPAGKALGHEGRIVVELRDGRFYSFAGSAPSFRQDGRLTYFARGAIRQLNLRCPLGSDAQRCSSVAVPARALVRAARRHPNGDVEPDDLRVSVRETAWLFSPQGRDRLVALLTLHIRTVGPFDLLALFEQGGLVDVVTTLEGHSGLRASPNGSYFGVLTGAPPGIRLFDRDGRSLTPLPLTSVRSFDWSHDEDWVAVATPNDVYAFRSQSLEGAGEPTVRRLGFVARDLAWRGVFVSL